MAVATHYDVLSKKANTSNTTLLQTFQQNFGFLKDAKPSLQSDSIDRV